MSLIAGRVQFTRHWRRSTIIRTARHQLGYIILPNLADEETHPTRNPTLSPKSTLDSGCSSILPLTFSIPRWPWWRTSRYPSLTASCT